MNPSPIFIHSLFRSGSTYVFEVFRRSDAGYWVYQEPLHETTFAAANNPEDLLTGFGEPETKLNRHPRLSSGYFQELYDAWPAWKENITEQMVYRNYFESKETKLGVGFWESLIGSAKGRPVFQECRTSGRIKAIKKALGGSHIYLWRNPWDQWWSYKINNYFNTANQLIIHADNAPAPLKLMLRALNLPFCAQQDLGEAFAFYRHRPLTSEQSYLVFYMLWCLALLEGANNADLLVNIDRLSESQVYQSEVLNKLSELDIQDINFSDCCVPQGFYSKDHQTFFAAAESRVHLWLIEGGWKQSDLEVILSLRQQYQPRLWSTPPKSIDPSVLLDQADRFQEMARRFETSVADHAQANLESKNEILQLLLKAQEAERRAAQANERECQSQSQLNQALVLVEQAQQITKQAEERTQEAEAATTYQRQLAEQRLKQIEAIYRSRSWRITALLRWPKHQAQLLNQYGLKARLKALLRKIINRINKSLLSKPKLRYRLVQLAKAIGLSSILKKLKNTLREPAEPQQLHTDQNAAQLSPYARKIYQQLQRAIALKKVEDV